MTEDAQASSENKGKGKSKRRPMQPKPVFVIYRKLADGDIELLDVTRDATVVLEKCEGQPDISYARKDVAMKL